jgi:hypothetical protein
MDNGINPSTRIALRWVAMNRDLFFNFLQVLHEAGGRVAEKYLDEEIEYALVEDRQEFLWLQLVYIAGLLVNTNHMVDVVLGRELSDETERSVESAKAIHKYMYPDIARWYRTEGKHLSSYSKGADIEARAAAIREAVEVYVHSKSPSNALQAKLIRLALYSIDYVAIASLLMRRSKTSGKKAV